MELSVIIPFVNEWPLLAATTASVHEELRDRVEHEVIVVDNWCDEVAKQGGGKKPDEGHRYMSKGGSRVNPWLKSLAYDKKLSHWQAKNLGVQNSTGRFLFFCDAHCIVSRDALFNAFTYYRDHHQELNGTLHLPLTYQLLEARILVYKLNCKPDKGFFHYSFDSDRYYRESAKSNGNPFQVPCMSTCGMLMTRELYDELGGWPEGLGIYGGGENFVNFTLATLGKTINVMPGPQLRHHGAKRGYSWNYGDHYRNRTLATRVFAGKKYARRFAFNLKGPKKQNERILGEAVKLSNEHRALIKPKQVIEITDWLEQWQGR